MTARPKAELPLASISRLLPAWRTCTGTAAGTTMWSSAPSPLLAAPKARAVSSPNKSGELSTAAAGALLPAGRVPCTPVKSTADQYRVLLPSNTYYLICVVTGALLVLLILINNPIKVACPRSTAPLLSLRVQPKVSKPPLPLGDRPAVTMRWAWRCT